MLCSSHFIEWLAFLINDNFVPCKRNTTWFIIGTHVYKEGSENRKGLRAILCFRAYGFQSGRTELSAICCVKLWLYRGGVGKLVRVRQKQKILIDNTLQRKPKHFLFIAFCRYTTTNYFFLVEPLFFPLLLLQLSRSVSL